MEIDPIELNKVFFHFNLEDTHNIHVKINISADYIEEQERYKLIL